MTKAAVLPRRVHSGTVGGTRGPFAISRDSVNIPFRTASDLVVRRRSSTGVWTTLTYPTDYTITGSADATGWIPSASITLTVAQELVYDDERIEIRRDMSRVQETAFAQAGAFPSVATELMADRAVVYTQDLAAQLEGFSGWIVVSGAPTSDDGLNGQMAVDATTGDLWGPKTDDGWGSEAVLNVTTAANGLLPANNLSDVDSAEAALINIGGIVRIENIAALRLESWAAASAPLLVALDHNWVAGDGGGIFRRDASDTSTADNGGTVVLTATSGTALRYKRQAPAGTVRTSWFGSNDAALTAANTATTAGGVLSVDNAITLASTWSGGSGKTLAFHGGTIAPPASASTFTWSGQIEAPVLRQIFTGANRAQARVGAECAFVRPEWWGALGDGTTDDYTAIAAALSACRLASGLRLRGAAYAIGTKIVIGDGTTTTRSTIHNGLFIEGEDSPGVGSGESGTPNVFTSLKWIGATGASETMMQIAGGIHSGRIENILFDCNSKAGGAGDFIHLYRWQIVNVYADSQYAGGWAWTLSVRDNAAYVSPYSAGFTQGFMETKFERFGVRGPPAGTSHAISIAGGKTNSVGFSRNLFHQCQFIRGNDASSISIRYSYADNNTFDRVLCVGTHATPSTGKALQRLTQSGGTFPKENVFTSTALVGTITTVDDTALTNSTDGGDDIATGYGGLDDGAPLTMPFGFRAIATDGRMIGKFSGAANELAGCATGGIATTALYFAADGNSAGDSFSGNLVTLLSAGMKFYRFRARCSVAPGGGNGRTATVYKNGSSTSLTVSYGAAESGDKYIDVATSVDANGADYIEVRWSHSGTPASAQVSWALYGYPQEVV